MEKFEVELSATAARELLNVILDGMTDDSFEKVTNALDEAQGTVFSGDEKVVEFVLTIKADAA